MFCEMINGNLQIFNASLLLKTPVIEKKAVGNIKDTTTFKH